jgi:hypothetical protein
MELTLRRGFEPVAGLSLRSGWANQALAVRVPRQQLTRIKVLTKKVRPGSLTPDQGGLKQDWLPRRFAATETSPDWAVDLATKAHRCGHNRSGPHLHMAPSCLPLPSPCHCHHVAT